MSQFSVSEVRCWLYRILSHLNPPKKFMIDPMEDLPTTPLTWVTKTGYSLVMSYHRFSDLTYLARGYWSLTLNGHKYLEILNPLDGFPQAEQPLVIFYADTPDLEVTFITLELLQEFNKRFSELTVNGVWFRFQLTDRYSAFERILEDIPFERVYADGHLPYFMPKVKCFYLMLHPWMKSENPLLLERSMFELLPECQEWIYLSKLDQIKDFDPRLRLTIHISVPLPSGGGPRPNILHSPAKPITKSDRLSFNPKDYIGKLGRVLKPY